MSTTTIGTIELLAKIDTSNYKKGAADIERANSQIERSSKTVNKSSDKVTDGLTRLAKRGFAAATGGAVLLGGAIAAMTIKGGISRALNIEDAQAKLRGLGHDAKSVSTIMDNALAAVKGTAFGLDAAATTAANAVASGVKPGKQLAGVLKTVANTAALAGRGMDEIGAIFNKVAASNKVQMDVINQLHDAGVPALALLSKELGKTAEETAKMASEGKINFATFEKAMRKGVGNAAEEMGKTTRGSIANMGAAFSRLGAKIVQDFIPKFRGGIQAITEYVDANSGKIVWYLGNIANAITGVDDSSKNLGRTIQGLFGPSLIALANTIQERLWPQLKKLWDAVNPGLTDAFKVWATLMKAEVVGAIWLAINVWNVMLTVISAIVKVATQLIKWWGNVAGAIKNAAETIINWISKIPGVFRENFSKLPSVVQLTLRGMYSTLTAPFAKAFDWVIGKINAVIRAFEDMKRRLSGGGTGVAGSFNVNSDRLIESFNKAGFATGGFTGHGAVDEVAGIVHKGEYVLPKSAVDQSTGMPKVQASAPNINITINPSGIMTDSTAGMREVAKKLVRLVNDELTAKGHPAIGGGAI